MTDKLTDEQVTAIKKLNSKGASAFVKIETPNAPDFIVQTVGFIDDPNTYWQVFPTALDIDVKNFKTANEAIAYAEHLLNQRYCWLPENNGWIMSGEVYNFANNGANKVLELSLIAWQNGFKEDKEDWFFAEFNNEGKVYQEIHGGFPSVELIKGVTIPAESPIWDAVAHVEVWEVK